MRRMPTSVEKDHDFLLKGDVFTKDVIETWLEYKRKKEVDAMRMRPHPMSLPFISISRPCQKRKDGVRLEESR